MSEKIIVSHRPDKLLQKSMTRVLEPELKDTFIERVTIPTHKALLAFLDDRVIGEHKGIAELETKLVTWPDFAHDVQKLNLHHDFSEIEIDQMEKFLFCGEGMGGPFVIALYQELALSL